jgi:hypothetical protein
MAPLVWIRPFDTVDDEKVAWTVPFDVRGRRINPYVRML